MSIWRKAVESRLRLLRDGRLVVANNGSRRAFGNGSDLAATLAVHDSRFYGDVALGGHIGAAESFMDGHWSCDDLPSLVRILVRNRQVLQGLEAGWARLAQPLRKALHLARRNTRRGSRRNIAAHYDLGNDFFQLFLDDTLTYSCGIFETPESSLRDASLAKYERICEKLELGPDDHVLEIGTGWGGFALHAAQRYGCRVTTTTISREQHELVARRVAAAGLTDRIDLLLRDYRELEGKYDKLVSIEMIEAVGHEFYDAYFAQCRRLLAPGGAFALQAITIRDELYDDARREVDFIKRYIFPGSCIPSLDVLQRSSTRAGLAVESCEDITPHYVETLRRWRRNFHVNHDRIRALGYGESFCRMWDFYFCYCEGGFAERYIGDHQLVLR